MKFLAIIQARVSSNRLPRKVLKPILGVPMLSQQIARLKQVKLFDQLIVATSDEASDDPIESLCQMLNVTCYRGSLNDVLDRYYQAAKGYQTENIVRLTGDCPLIDPEQTNNVLNLHLTQKADYTSNCCPPTLPDGLDIEVFTKDSLNKSWALANKPSEREHVTQFMRNHPEQFDLANYQYKEDLSALRWTVDEPSDLEFVRQVYQYLYDKNHLFSMQDILTLLTKHPHLIQINKNHSRDEGLAKSLADDIKLGYK
jgi:spore coat polysaccharide biosynthesis protein SpsF